MPTQPTQGGEKRRVTLFSLLNVKGELFPQLLVLKGTWDGRIHKEVEDYEDVKTRNTVQGNAWTDGFVLIDWLYKIWRPIAKTTRDPKLLILDSYPLHQEFQKKFAIEDTEILFVPSGLTWAL